MKIQIDGKPADIILETEKTAGEVLAGIEDWLETAGLFVSGVELDGERYGAQSLEEAFASPLEGLSSINIITSSWAELMTEALAGLKGDLELYETLPAEEQADCRRRWEDSPQAAFLKNNAPELHGAALTTFDGGFSTAKTLALAGERIRELEAPEAEAAGIKPLAEDTAQRLEDLPLDMQTGKDSRAAETILLFSALAEKILRLIVIFRYSCAGMENTEVPAVNGAEKTSLKTCIEEFSAALKELISAYENKDTVLAGDLAEYELAPRLRSLSGALRGIKMGAAQ